ncbi:MAG: VWA domain-containing protein [Stigonema ocellatum SAG 48.90 = DSM 106950]|nr:VWA domain-containing protein [Stigonema ocellatum SAG 48.90 = DSM 106950]
MAKGLRQALNLLKNENMSIRRALLFTDGHTVDEHECRELAQQFASNNIPITLLAIVRG